jgi:hypothetical protein
MTADEFSATLSDAAPPSGLHLALLALWWDGKGNWRRAHEHAQEDESDPVTAWVHAYLHRKEGDPSNAGYWYRRAGKHVATGDLNAEWRSIVTVLLEAFPPNPNS